ncbi:MAG: sensor histidine kinase [Anaerolineae bacterium]
MALPIILAHRPQRPLRLTPRLIALAYTSAGCFWILLSDRLALLLAGDSAGLLSLLQVYKGWAYVLVTGLLLYFLVRRSTDEHKQMAAELQRLNENLERRVHERTSQLEAAIGELEAFSYSVSHDLRAPLRSMGGFSRILVEEYGAILPPEAQHYLERIRAGAEEMGNLIQALLDLSRLRRWTISSAPAPTPSANRRATPASCCST